MSSSDPLAGTFTTDAALVVRTWDDALARATGLDPALVIGRPLVEIIPSIATRGLLSRFEEVVSTGAVHVFSPGLHGYLLPCPPATPSPRFAHMQQRVTVGPLREGERVAGVLVAIEDVTARLDAERDLADALAAGRDDWRTRRAVVQRLSQAPGADFARSLVGIIKTHHRDFSVLSSTLQLLAGTGVDVSDALGELLRDADPDVRLQAALALGQQRAPGAADALIRALDDADVNVRFQAIESLGRLRVAAAVDALVRIAQSDDGFLAFAAIDALGAIKDPGAAAALIPLLGRDDLRPAVISALGSTGDEAVIAPLIHALHAVGHDAAAIADAIASVYQRLEHAYQSGATVADIVARALEPAGVRHLIDTAEAKPETAPSIVRVLGWAQHDEARAALVRWLSLPNARGMVLEVLPAHGEAVVEPLIDQLTAPDDEVRRAAVIALGRLALPRATRALVTLIESAPDLSGVTAGALARIGDPEAFEGLMTLLGHADAGVRQAAVGALSSLSHPSMPARLLPLLDSDDPRLRESAVRIAGYFGYASARDRVRQLTADPVEAVRCAALESVPFFEGGDEFEVLRKGLDAESPTVRAAALRAMGRLDDDRARAALLEAVHDESFWVRYYAVRALGDHRHSAAVHALESAALHDPAPPVRIAAVEALAAIAPDFAATLFVQLADDQLDELAAAAVTALGRLRRDDGRAAVRRAIRDHRRAVRVAAINALTAEPDDDAVLLLHGVAATDADEDIRRTTIDAMAEVARRGGRLGEEVAELLVAMLTDPDRGVDAAAALAHLPADQLGVVARQLHHPDPSIRRAVVEMLGRSRHAEATTLLFDALNDDAPGVRDAAMLALGRRRHVV